MTLDEIKAQNAAEAATNQQTEVVKPVVEIEAGETTDDEGKEAPFWMQEEEVIDDEEGTESKAATAPVSALVKLKRKLKGTISERDEEIERLRLENETLKASRTAPHIEIATQAPKRPRNADFDTDDEYEEAMDKYEADKMQFAINHVSTSHSQADQIKQRTQKVLANVDSHYDRAAKLVEESGINPEVYQQADKTVKSIIESIMPGKSEAVFNGIIDIIGEGSEKTLFYIGRNKAAQNEFAALLAEDPTGLKASIYLGRATERIIGTKTQTTRAPAPSAQLRGDNVSSVKESAFKKKYEAAHGKGDVQAAFNAKQEAKKAGINVKEW